MSTDAIVLIVDDQEPMVRLLENTIHSAKISTRSAMTPARALEILNNEPIDLILMDVMLCDRQMDGFSLCSRIKQDENLASIPVIFLTALGELDHINQGFQAGAVDYVTKPFKSLELLSRIDVHIKLRKSKLQVLSMNEELNRVNEELHESNLTKDRLLSIIAHDLRGPLSAFVNIAELVHQEFQRMSPSEILSSLDVMRRDSKRLFLLLENLLEWSRLQLEPAKPQPSPVSMQVLVHQTFQLLQEAASNKRIRLEQDISEDAIVFADSYMVQAVLRNLVSNAIKFSKEGGRVSVHCQLENSDLECIVKDEGVGIPLQTQPRIFSTHHIYSTRGTSGERGSGLGLILCKEFLERNNGSIRFDSRPGSGTSFIFRLPGFNR